MLFIEKNKKENGKKNKNDLERQFITNRYL